MAVHKQLYWRPSKIEVYPTARGWTVHATVYQPIKHKKWLIKENTNVADHTFTEVKHAVTYALEWLRDQSTEGS